MFDEHAAEPLHGTERGAVNHHRAMEFAVASLVRQIKAFREVVVHLNGAELPFSADDIANDEVDFRPVKGRLALFLRPGHAEGFSGRSASVFCFVPALWVANVLGRIRVSQTHANPVVFHAEFVKDDLHEFNAAEHLVSELILGDEEVCVVLGEATHPCHA